MAVNDSSDLLIGLKYSFVKVEPQSEILGKWRTEPTRVIRIRIGTDFIFLKERYTATAVSAS